VINEFLEKAKRIALVTYFVMLFLLFPPSQVILWDYNKKKAIQVFKGMREGVTNLSFSHDDKFLAATSLNNTITIWNCSDFSLVHNKVIEVPISLIQWAAPK